MDKHSVDLKLEQVVEEFGRAARHYCAVVESGAEMDRQQWLVDIATALGDLYAAGLRLPEVSPDDADWIDRRPPVDRQIGVNLPRLLGQEDVYWTVYDPRQCEEPVAGSLGDDLVDVYRDVAEGIALVGRGAPPQAVIWTWRFGFWSHWGKHAVEALRAMHHLQND